MPAPSSHYEEALARLSHHQEALELLKQHRPYLEMVPSVRRPEEALITVPLPTVAVRRSYGNSGDTNPSAFHELVSLPCELAYLMCDPEWKVKVGAEIFVFIQRPEEDFSQLLGRWRQTQVALSPGYRWHLTPRFKHLSGESSEQIYPLFVVFAETPERVKNGLQGACLPFVLRMSGSTLSLASAQIEVLDREIQGSC